MVAVARAVARGGGVGAVEDDGDVAVTAVGVEAVDCGVSGSTDGGSAADRRVPSKHLALATEGGVMCWWGGGVSRKRKARQSVL